MVVARPEDARWTRRRDCAATSQMLRTIEPGRPWRRGTPPMPAGALSDMQPTPSPIARSLLQLTSPTACLLTNHPHHAHYLAQMGETRSTPTGISMIVLVLLVALLKATRESPAAQVPPLSPWSGVPSQQRTARARPVRPTPSPRRQRRPCAQEHLQSSRHGVVRALPTRLVLLLCCLGSSRASKSVPGPLATPWPSGTRLALPGGTLCCTCRSRCALRALRNTPKCGGKRFRREQSMQRCFS